MHVQGLVSCLHSVLLLSNACSAFPTFFHPTALMEKHTALYKSMFLLFLHTNTYCDKALQIWSCLLPSPSLKELRVFGQQSSSPNHSMDIGCHPCPCPGLFKERESPILSPKDGQTAPGAPTQVCSHCTARYTFIRTPWTFWPVGSREQERSVHSIYRPK